MFMLSTSRFVMYTLLFNGSPTSFKPFTVNPDFDFKFEPQFYVRLAYAFSEAVVDVSFQAA